MTRPFQSELTWYDQPEEIIRRNGGFSGCDIDIVVRLPGTYDRRGRPLSEPVVYQLGSIQTLSYQSYNSKEAVRSLGFKNVRGYARGSRTIAGTLMFNQLYTHVLDDVGNATILNDSKGILTHSSGRVTYYRNAPINPAIQEALGDNVNFESPRVTRKRHNFDFSWDQNTIGRQLKASDLPPFDIIAIFVNEYGHVGKMIIYGVDLVTEGGVLSIEDIYTEVSMQYVARDIEYFHSETQAGLRDWTGISPFAQAEPSGKENVGDVIEQANQRIWNSVYRAGDAAAAESIERIENRMIQEENTSSVILSAQNIARNIFESERDSLGYGNPEPISFYTQPNMDIIGQLRLLDPQLMNTEEGTFRIQSELMSLLNGTTSIPILLQALYRDLSININTQGRGFTRGPESVFLTEQGGGQMSTVNATTTPIDIALVQYMISWLEDYSRDLNNGE